MSTEEKIRKIREARALIAEPEHWCQHVLAVDAGGREYTEDLPGHPARWCAVGATLQVEYSNNDQLDEELEHTLELRNGTEFELLHIYNDSHTHTEVLQLFDDTIARLEAQLQGASV